MTRTNLGLCTTLIALSGLAYACGSLGSADSTSLEGPGDPGARGPDGATGGQPPSQSAGDLAPVDNGVILVHAAKAQSFRLCFANEPERRPQPDSQVMPDSNVVGVEVGSAVRIGPLKGPPGEVLLFEEPLIRAVYPTFGGAGNGPTCGALRASASLGNLAISLGSVTTDLSRGVHLLVVRGCPGNGPLNTHDLAECGAGWTAAKGNLSVEAITLPGANRPSDGILPAQVVNLSQPLEGARAGRDVVVSFGLLSGADSAHAAVTSNPPLFGKADPSDPAKLAYDSNDLAVYDSTGFRVRLVTPGSDGGASTKVLDESLARIQKLSAPRDVPPSYYAAASNYALLLLGDPDAKLPDGGPDMDDRRNLHFLAVPVIEPKEDGGADAGPGEPLDGGSAPSP